MRSECVSQEPEPPGHLHSAYGLKRKSIPATCESTVRDTSLITLKSTPGEDRSTAFCKQFYPSVTQMQWNNWRWQLRHSIASREELARIIDLNPEERDGLFSHNGNLPLRITPYYASLIKDKNSTCGLRRSIIPVSAELMRAPEESDDPLNEESHSPVPAIVHRYPDRVLFLVTNFCSTYCRYCTRSRILGNKNKSCYNLTDWEKAIAYIEKTPIIRDVLLSGGDPLTLSDKKLEWLLSRLRQIPHIELLRIGTKVPVVLPQRITPKLVRMLKRYHPLWISLHVIHPDEITPEMSQACIRLADAGIPLGSQTVLLAGINDNVYTMKKLVHGLIKIRVRPYYLYQCDHVSGTAHFRTSVEKGLHIIESLRGHTTGYAVPTYVIDAPGGGGKIPLYNNAVMGRDGDDLLLRNYEGNIFRYRNNKRIYAEGNNYSQ
ncbi:MAG: KamA family radical SAM protein [bacterium]